MSGLYLNYCFCKVTPNIEQVFATDYADNDIKKLRDAYSDYRFYRDGNQILYWPKTVWNAEAISALKSTKQQISTLTHPAVISKMIENRIYDAFASVGGYNLDFEKYSHTLVAKKVAVLFSDEALDINECAKISTYFFRKDAEIYFGFTVSSNLSHSFKWTRADFKSNGIDATGLLENQAGKVAANTMAIMRYKDAKGVQTKANIESRVGGFESRAGQFRFIHEKVIKWLKSKLRGKLYKNIEITDCEINYLPYGNTFESDTFKTPKKYYANDQTANYKELPSSTLKRVGPYKAQGENNNLNITLVALKDNEGTLNAFTRQLSTELQTMFKLNVNFTNIWVANDTVKSFEDAIAPISAKSTDLVIFVLKKDQRDLKSVQSPYLFCKAKLIGQEIPTQCVLKETIQRLQPNDFIVGNIALNIYAKFGGTAWGIEKQDTTKRELIIGIGSTVNWKNEKVVSIANIFESSGVYVAGSCNPIIDLKNYSTELEKLIKELFYSILQDEKEVHLIFHIFKTAGKDKEIRVLENVIQQYSDVNISYAFVHLSYGHNFRLFYNDGKSDLYKGQFILISKTESLLAVSNDGTIPLKVSIDKRSNFKDIFYITQQTFSFAHLSERSFKASKKPITILYPSIMARLIEDMKYQVIGWDENKLKIKGVTEKLWFL